MNINYIPLLLVMYFVSGVLGLLEKTSPLSINASRMISFPVSMTMCLVSPARR